IRGEPGQAAPPMNSRIEQLRSELARIRSLATQDRPEPLRGLVGRITDPVSRLNPQYARLLQGPFRSEVMESLKVLFDPNSNEVSMPILQLLDAMEDKDSLPTLVSFESRHPFMRVSLAVLRAILGDQTIVPELQTLRREPGTIDKHRVELGLLCLGEVQDAYRALASLETRYPVCTARILRALGRLGHEEVVPIGNCLLHHQHWLYAPVRQALLMAIEGLSDSAPRRRLLARLAHDFEPTVARRAREILKQEFGAEVAGPLILAGAAESGCDDALLNEEPGMALQSMKDATARYGPGFPGATLKLARILEFEGDTEGARRALAALVPAVDDPAVRARVRSRIEHPLDVPLIMDSGTGPFEILGVTTELRSLIGQNYHVRLTIKNTSDRNWPGFQLPIWTGFRVSFRNAEHPEISGSPSWTISLGAADVPPGATTTITIPFTTPMTPGTYELMVRSVITKFTVTTVSEAVATGRTIELVTSLP
ncbi:MAG: hypothetical protein KDB53_06395, partial [Planctomycetes bacterium]|nr:hypothetical protein [Planctomycetota bacterium]